MKKTISKITTLTILSVLFNQPNIFIDFTSGSDVINEVHSVAYAADSAVFSEKDGSKYYMKSMTIDLYNDNSYEAIMDCIQYRVSLKKVTSKGDVNDRIVVWLAVGNNGKGYNMGIYHNVLEDISKGSLEEAVYNATRDKVIKTGKVNTPEARNKRAYALAYLSDDSNDPNNAIRCCEASLSEMVGDAAELEIDNQNGTFVWRYYDRARIYEIKGNAYINRALQLKTKSGPEWNECFEKAINSFNEVLKYRNATYKEKGGNYNENTGAYDKIVYKDVKMLEDYKLVEILQKSARCYATIGKYNEAFNQIKKALEIYPENKGLEDAKKYYESKMK